MLDMFFNPGSVAVIGASENPKKLGHRILLNVVNGGYKGAIYPINPTAKEILGLKCYPSVSDIPTSGYGRYRHPRRRRHWHRG